jgi:hypothetical protein
MTQRDFYNAIANNTELAPELTAFAKEAIEALNKKNEARNSKANAKKAEVNAPIIAAIREALADGKPHFASDVATAVEQSLPKVAALVKTMEDVTVGKAKKEGAKAKTTTYTLTVAE